MPTPSALVSPISSAPPAPVSGRAGRGFPEQDGQPAGGEGVGRGVEPDDDLARAAMVAVGRAGEQDGTGRVRGFFGLSLQ